MILEAVESLLAEDVAPDGDVYLSFGDDEEIGGSHGPLSPICWRVAVYDPIWSSTKAARSSQGMIPAVSGQLAMIGGREGPREFSADGPQPSRTCIRATAERCGGPASPSHRAAG